MGAIGHSIAMRARPSLLHDEVVRADRKANSLLVHPPDVVSVWQSGG